MIVRAKTTVLGFWRELAVIGLACAVLASFLHLADASAFDALKSIFTGTLSSAPTFSHTLDKTAPYLFAGASVFLALKVGLFNIGSEGQIVVGACACAAVELKFGGLTGAILAAIAGVLAGALWAMPAGFIKAYRNGHEVITTIMLNSVAGFLTVYLLAGPMQKHGQSSPTTDTVLQPISSLHVGDLRISYAIFIGVIVIGMLHFYLSKSVSGLELQAVGAGPRAAQFAGVNSAKVTAWSMTVSGALSGLAGVILVQGFEGRFFKDFSAGIGFNALGVALLAGPSAYGLIPAALLFGILDNGSVQLQINQIPQGITNVFLGVIILVAAIFRYRRAMTHE